MGITAHPKIFKTNQKIGKKIMYNVEKHWHL